MSKELNIFYDEDWADIENIEIMYWRLGSNQNVISNIEVYRDRRILFHWQLKSYIRLNLLVVDISDKEYDFIIKEIVKELKLDISVIKTYIEYE